MKRITRHNLEVVVFICGAVVMVFELIGSRITAPYLGTSLYVWTSIIGVILASLSLGYHFGGTLADRRPEVRPLAGVIFLSAFALLGTYFLKSGIPLLIANFPLSLELKSVCISIVLFAPTSFLLGMVSPYAVRLRVEESKKAGSVAGNLYAISTAGSIFGTFIGGFYLIPHIGTTVSLLILAALLVTAALLLVGTQIFSILRRPFFPLVLVFLGSSAILSHASDTLLQNQRIQEIDTEYSKILVYPGTDARTKKPTLHVATDPFGTQAAIFTDGTDDLVFDYTKFYRLAEFFVPDIENALMVGGSAYTYPRDFLRQFEKATMDVVEIDSGMTEIARKYFGLIDAPRMSILHEDGRIFLNRNEKVYDVIFMDAFNSASSIPFHLTTTEAVQKMHDQVREGGAVLVNLISAFEGDRGKFFRAEYATYKKIFPQVYVFGIDDRVNGGTVQNLMLVALKSSKVPLFEEADASLCDKLSHLWTKSVPGDVPILTDDFAPVEYYKKLSIEG